MIVQRTMSGTSYSWIFAVLVCFVFHSASAAPTLDCPRSIPNGEYHGKITGLIEKDGWSMNYLFKPNGEEVGCIQLNAVNNLPRANLLLTAYLTNALVKIQVKGNHEVGGVAHGN